MPAPDQVLLGILSGAAQIPDGLVRFRRRMKLGQKPGPQELGKLARVTAVGLHPLSWLARNQRRRHHHA
jgi:hypothetical protein